MTITVTATLFKDYTVFLPQEGDAILDIYGEVVPKMAEITASELSIGNIYTLDSYNGLLKLYIEKQEEVDLSLLDLLVTEDGVEEVRENFDSFRFYKPMSDEAFVYQLIEDKLLADLDTVGVGMYLDYESIGQDIKNLSTIFEDTNGFVIKDLRFPEAVFKISQVAEQISLIGNLALVS